VSGRPAAFLDRDGTLIEDRHYLRDPEGVRLLPGAADAVRRLNRAGVAAVLITNQSGIARGLLTEAEYAATAARLAQLLGDQEAQLDAAYHCPHLPDLSGPCDCRKPGPLLYQRAAQDLGLDLSRSWWIGDRPRDVEGARHWSGRGILLLASDNAVERERAERQGWATAADLAAAVRLVLDARP
jgi:D-glycero-D-manno-heptose 1,7-bisphosphate phosphatase